MKYTSKLILNWTEYEFAADDSAENTENTEEENE